MDRKFLILFEGLFTKYFYSGASSFMDLSWLIEWENGSYIRTCVGRRRRIQKSQECKDKKNIGGELRKNLVASNKSRVDWFQDSLKKEA